MRYVLLFLLFAPVSLLADSDEFNVVTPSRIIHSLLSGLMGRGSPDLLAREPTRRRHQLESADLVFVIDTDLDTELAPDSPASRAARIIRLLDHEELKILPQRVNTLCHPLCSVFLDFIQHVQCPQCLLRIS